MFETVLTLRESEDEYMHCDANNIFRLMSGNIAELMGDRMADFIQEFIDNASIKCRDCLGGPAHLPGNGMPSLRLAEAEPAD